MRTWVKNTHGRRMGQADTGGSSTATAWFIMWPGLPGALVGITVVAQLGSSKMQHAQSGLQHLDCRIYPWRELTYSPSESQHLDNSPRVGG